MLIKVGNHLTIKLKKGKTSESPAKVNTRCPLPARLNNHPIYHSTSFWRGSVGK